MKRILYLTNIEAPYRVRFFNALADHCRLTVAYERRSSSNRDADWLRSKVVITRLSFSTVGKSAAKIRSRFA